VNKRPCHESSVVQKWFLGAVLLLVVALVFRVGLVAYAMYTLLGVMLLSRFLARTWSEHLTARRECNRLSANVGETVAVVITIEKQGSAAGGVAAGRGSAASARADLTSRPTCASAVGGCTWPCSIAADARRSTINSPAIAAATTRWGRSCWRRATCSGLHRRYRVATEPHFLLVYPQVQPLEGFDIASRRPIGEVRMS